MRKLNVNSDRAGTTSTIIVGNETHGSASRYPVDFHADENVCDCGCCWNSRFGRPGREGGSGLRVTVCGRNKS